VLSAQINAVKLTIGAKFSEINIKLYTNDHFKIKIIGKAFPLIYINMYKDEI